MATVLRASLENDADELVGAIRRFGEYGPVYEVIGAAHPDERGRACVRIRVVETGEEVDYPVEEVRADPGE